MTKTIKIVLVIAAALILAGALLAFGAFAASGFNAENFGAGEFETKTYTPEGALSSVGISVRTSDVDFYPAEDGVLRVECCETEKQPHEVSLSDGKLTVSAVDQRKWYEKITIFSKSPKVKIYLPAGEYEALKLETDTGDVVFHGTYSFLKLDVETDTGDVELGGTFATSVRIKTDTGDVTATPLTAGNVGIRTNTGKVILDGARCADLSVETDTGKVKLTDVSCAALTVETDTGDVILKNVVGTGDAKIDTDTGDVKLYRCDAASYKIKTDTGDVEGTILSEKVFFAKSRTGDVDVPKTRAGGDFDASSGTGDIEITIAD